ncbi:MAG: YfhO family protein [Oscillospiraceae bacterium]|nr:YfhO family protein [Oscillospiraceae bacterium]
MDKLKRWAKENCYVAASGVGATFLMIFMWFVHNMVPFVSGERGVRSILHMDLFHQYAPLFGELQMRLTGGGSLLYSWYSGLGGGFLGNFFNYLSSPIGIITVLLFGHQRVPEAIAVMVLIKCVLAAVTFSYMLKKMFGLNNFSIAAFGILYAFCAWLLAYYWNVMWLDALALLPLIALGIHYCVTKGKFALYAVSLAIAMFSSFYMGFMLCIFSVLFFFVQYFSNYELEAKLPEANKPQPKILRLRLPRAMLAFGAGSLLAGGLAAIALLPTFFALQSSSATGASMPDNANLFFSAFDFLAQHMASLNVTYRGHGMNALPNVYSGVIALLLAPLFLLAPKIKLREKIVYSALMVFMFLSMNVNILNWLWHAGKFPNDLPHRFSFIYSFLLLFIAFRAFQHIRDISAKALLGVGVGVAAFVIIVERVGTPMLQRHVLQHNPGGNNVYGNFYITIAITLAFLLVYGILLLAHMKGDKRWKAGLALLLFCAVITEVSAASINQFRITAVRENFTSGVVQFQHVRNNILDFDDELFSRMEVTDSRTHMAPAWYGYRGISTFSSMANERVANLQNRLGMDSNHINSYIYNPNTPVFNAMHNLRWLVENHGHDHNHPPRGSSFVQTLNPMIYQRHPQLDYERFTVFENRYPLSVAFWAHDNLRQWETAHMNNPIHLQQDFWQRASHVQEDVFTPLEIQINHGSSSHPNLSPEISGTNMISFSERPQGQYAVIPLLLISETDTNVYIHFDRNYIHGLYIMRADRTEARHRRNTVIDIGEIRAGEPLEIELRLTPRHNNATSGSFRLDAYAIDMDTFRAGYEVLSQGALQLTAFSDTRLAGTITAPEDGLMFTSIPFDESWRVFLNGQRVPLLSTGNGAYLAIDLPEGTHEIEMHYRPRGLVLGAAASAVSVLMLALAIVLPILAKKKARQQPAAEDSIVEQPEPTQALPASDIEGQTCDDLLDVSIDEPQTEAVAPAPPPEEPVEQNAAIQEAQEDLRDMQEEVERMQRKYGAE